MSDFMQGNKDDAIAVPFSDDDTEKTANDNDLDKEDSPSATVEERLSRAQRRSARAERLIAEGKQNAERVKTLEADLAALRGETERLKGYVAAQPQRQANDNAKDPYEARLDAIYERQNEAYNAAQAELKAQTWTPERQAHYEKIARKIESDKAAVHADKAVAQNAQGNRADAAQQVWVQRFPEVYQNPEAFNYAKATYERRLALREPATHQMVEEVMAETMATFRLGPKKAPTANDRARMSGLPSAGSGGSGNPGGIQMTPALRRMAIAAYGELPEAEAIKRWVNGPGKRLREKKVI